MAGTAYSVADQQTVTTPLDSVLSLEGSATVTMWLHYIAMSYLSDELDDMVQWTLQRTTADGTGDSLTPTPFHDADIAAQGVFQGNHSTDPTYTAGEILLDIGVNTRSSQQFFAQPGREIMTAAAANQGYGLGALHGSSAPLCLATIHFSQ